MAPSQFPQPAGNTRAPPTTYYSSATAIGVVSSHQQQHLGQQHYPQQQQQQLLGSPAVQYQQVADIIRATGHQPSSLGLNTQQLYSSAPSSTVAVNHLTNPRPPVPLFRQSTGNNPQQNKMFSDPEDFTAFGGVDMSRSASSSTNVGTISPHELVMSAPGSAVFTDLTSPSIYTPDIGDVSPMYNNAGDWELGVGENNPDNWTSLFPDSEDVAAQSYNMVDQSPVVVGSDLDSTVKGHERRKSSNVSPKSASRHSVHAGVNARKRDKPLPPIIVDDPNDTVAVKRARNTLAARKSRQRKAQKMEEYEATIDEKDAEIERLTAERDHWKAVATGLGLTG